MMSDRSSHHDAHDDSGGWQISQCACGRLTIRLGAVRVEFSREEFAQLHCLVQQAMTEFQVPPSQQTVCRIRTATTH
jgi:hypothetical protein